MPDPETASSAAIDTVPPDWGQIKTDILCPLCSYNLRGLTEPRCPECGYRFAWPEVLDPRRRLHPYLFEHHPERNVRSFCRTAVGALLPTRFWKSLHPIQPSDRRRLIIYVLVGQGLYLLALLGLNVWSAYSIAQANKAVITRRTATLTARYKSMSPQKQQLLIQGYGSLQAYISKTRPPASSTTAGALMYRFSSGRFPMQFLACAGIPLAWPWLSYLTLRIFAISMRRARVNKTHVLRCVIYSFDLALWVALYDLATTSIGFMCGGTPYRVEPIVYVGIALIWAAGGLYGMLRLYAAYRFYLRFDRPFATVLSSQLIVALIATNVAVFFTLQPF